jgi:DNA-binding transcriptional LysR family regulator
MPILPVLAGLGESSLVVFVGWLPRWNTYLFIHAACHLCGTRQGAREQLFDTVDMCVQSAERGLGVAIADAALFTDLIASQKVVKPFDIEVDNGNAYFLTYPPERREQRSIRLFEEWTLSVLRG